jgi:hypothetical protein
MGVEIVHKEFRHYQADDTITLQFDVPDPVQDSGSVVCYRLARFEFSSSVAYKIRLYAKRSGRYWSTPIFSEGFGPVRIWTPPAPDDPDFLGSFDVECTCLAHVDAGSVYATAYYEPTSTVIPLND